MNEDELRAVREAVAEALIAAGTRLQAEADDSERLVPIASEPRRPVGRMNLPQAEISQVADDQHVFTVKEVARLLGLHHTTVYNLVRAGDIRSHRTRRGGRIFIPRTEVLRLLA